MKREREFTFVGVADGDIGVRRAGRAAGGGVPTGRYRCVGGRLVGERGKGEDRPGYQTRERWHRLVLVALGGA